MRAAGEKARTKKRGVVQKKARLFEYRAIFDESRHFRIAPFLHEKPGTLQQNSADCALLPQLRLVVLASTPIAPWQKQ